MQRKLKIGTRDSQLALWQAKTVQSMLEAQGISTELELIKSEGDINLVDPLYEMGVTGIFTKTLDAALLTNRIDIAVHSFKDVPTQLPKGLSVSAVPKRGNWKDALVCKSPDFFDHAANDCVIATSSLRRKAQWLHRYPNHSTANLRGNINTRLKKLQEENWDAALFAAAGIERIGLEVPNRIDLDWMLPAPAQGAMVIVCRTDDNEADTICKSIHHEMTGVCTHIERMFLRGLMGGCSMPIAGLATPEGDNIRFKGNVYSIDGTRKAEVEMILEPHQFNDGGQIAADQVRKNGGEAILEELKNFKVD